jgi:hypothetical protein
VPIDVTLYLSISLARIELTSCVGFARIERYWNDTLEKSAARNADQQVGALSVILTNGLH